MNDGSTRDERPQLLVLGATGGIGRWVVRDAVAAGWSVRALVRAPATFEPGVETRVGDPLIAADMAAALDGVTGVVLALGIRRRTESIWAPLTSPPDVVARAARLVVQGAGTRALRVITISAHGARDSWDRLPWIVRAVVRASKVRFSYTDHAAQENVLESSGLPVLILRPTMLSDDTSLACIEVTDPGVLPLTATVSRRAVARYAVEALSSTRTGIVTLSASGA